MVRFSEYLHRNGVEFLCVCAHDGYAHKDLLNKGIEARAILPIALAPDYFYRGPAGRRELVDAILSKVRGRSVRFVSFCMRDLYAVRAACTELANATIIHLILHIQDDLYLGQTVAEKIVYRLTRRRCFGNSATINFNRQLLSEINGNRGLICMADLIAEVWHSNFGIDIPADRIIPLPSFVENSEDCVQENRGKKIIWIGRIVDFKTPALLAMIDFLASKDGYELTIIGDGDRSALIKRMKDQGINPNRINFLGEVPYSRLGEFIRGHSIGYAMGTSLIELARFRIPVVIALASFTHETFNRPICGGLFFDQPKGADGSELALRQEGEISTTIEDAINVIENEWNKVANNCYEYARSNYSVDNNFSEYLKIIESADWISSSNKNTTQSIPSAPLVRRLAHRLFNRRV